MIVDPDHDFGLPVVQPDVIGRSGDVIVGRGRHVLGELAAQVAEIGQARGGGLVIRHFDVGVGLDVGGGTLFRGDAPVLIAVGPDGLRAGVAGPFVVVDLVAV